MARDLSAGFESEIVEKDLRPVLLVKAEFDSGDVILNTSERDITYDGDTYLGSGVLLNISPVQETQKLQANGVQFTLNGIPSSLVSIALSEEFQFRPITMFFGVRDSSYDLISDPYKLFSGKMDVMEINDDGENSAITIQAENDMIDFKVSRERFYTDEDQKTEYPADVGLEFIASLQDKEVTWGQGL